MKRRIYFLYIIWVQVVAISLSSCDDELTDINRNPNKDWRHDTVQRQVNKPAVDFQWHWGCG